MLELRPTVFNLNRLDSADVRSMFNTFYDSISGTIRWKKTYGHPKLTKAESSTAVRMADGTFYYTTYCVGVHIFASYFINDPTSTTGEPKPQIPVPSGNPPICSHGSDNPDYYQLNYRISGVPFNKETTVNVYLAEEREWVPGSDPNSGTAVRRFKPIEGNGKVTLDDQGFFSSWATIDFEMDLLT